MSERPQHAPPWEYKLVRMGNPLEDGVEERANAFGHLGWELVTIDAGVWVFKRPLAADSQAEDPLAALMEQTVPIVAEEPVMAVSQQRGAVGEGRRSPAPAAPAAPAR